MKRDASVFLKHILESTVIIEKYVKGHSEQDLLGSMALRDAVMRRLSVIGEAARNVPGHIKAKNKSVEWKAIMGLKNILVHEYFGVDLKVIWRIAKVDLPKLKSIY